MSEDIKMADVFELALPLETSPREDGEGFDVFDANNNYVMTIAADYSEIKALLHAVNNYDRLVEENEELKRRLDKASCEAEVDETVVASLDAENAELKKEIEQWRGHSNKAFANQLETHNNIKQLRESIDSILAKLKEVPHGD